MSTATPLGPGLVPGQTAKATSELFAAYIADDTTRGLVQKVVQKRGWSPKQVKSGGLPAAARALGVIAAPQILLVDVTGVANAPEALQGLGEAFEAGTKILTIGTENDVGLYRRMLDAGAADYLVKPLDADAIDLMIARAERPNADPDGKPAGRVIVVTGARGGVGTSTVAGEIAWLSSTRHGRRTALLDLDLSRGTTALSFDVPPGTGLAEALASPDRIDDLLLDRAASAVTPMLSLYAAEEGLDAAEATGSGALALLDRLARRLPVVIVDLPFRSPVFDAVAGRAKDLIVVSDAGLAGLRDSIRLYRHMEPYAEDIALHILQNRVPKSGGAVARGDFEKQLGNKLAAVLPFDEKAAEAAMRLGQPVQAAAPSSPLTKGLTGFTAGLYPAPKPVKKGLFARLVRRR
ncbi:MAG: hypothetical protein NXI16_08570 [Alphaproteobacteria bacterium]|nr:hypothetical protein [Alphaproteobacteria bacterium]